MINKGLHNTVEKKAVACNIIEEIIKRVEEVLVKADDYTLKHFDDMYKSDFNAVKALKEKCEDYHICELVNFLHDYGELEHDIAIYTCEYYSAKARYSGVSKLPNGAEVYVMCVFQEEHGNSMCMTLYFDGEQLRLFTPYEGNFVNTELKTSLGDEEYSCIKEIDYDEVEDIIDNYVKQFGYTYDDIESGEVSIDWEAVCNEIDMVLS